jgi:hypothetical protein
MERLMVEFGLTREEALEDMMARDQLNQNPGMPFRIGGATSTTSTTTITPGAVVPAGRTLAQRRIDLIERTFKYPHHLYIPLVVDREHALVESIPFLNGDVQNLASSGLHASFRNEPGYGPGITKDWINELTKQIFGPERELFTMTLDVPNYYKINPRGMWKYRGLDIYRAIGRFLALSILRNQPLGVNLPVFFYARMLDQSLTLADMRTEEPQFANSMDYLLSLETDEELAAYPITIDEIDYPVTLGNRAELIRRKVNSFVRLEERSAFALIRQGFDEVFPVNPKPFTAAEFKQLILGNTQVDIDDLMRNAKMGLQSEQRQMLHRVLQSFTPEQKTGFLRFVTNLNQAPVGGFALVNPPVWLRTNYYPQPEDHKLPRVLLCHNLIDLPIYLNDAEMKERLLHAMEIGHGWVK